MPIYQAASLIPVLPCPAALPEGDVVGQEAFGNEGCGTVAYYEQEMEKMKVAVTSYGENIDSKVDRSFGRTRWFVVMDTVKGTCEAHSNTQNADAPQGAGIQAARNIVNLGVDILLTGNVGPNAFKALSTASIQVFIFDRDVETVNEAVLRWKSGDLAQPQKATIEGHWI